MRVWKRCMVAILSVLLVFAGTPGISFANIVAINFVQPREQESENEDLQKGGIDEPQEGESNKASEDFLQNENADESRVEAKPSQGDAQGVDEELDEELDEDATSMPAIQLKQPELVEMEANIELQPLIESTEANGTLSLEPGKIYSGTVTISKTLTINGEGATLKGSIENTAPTIITNLIIESPAGPAVKSTASLTMTGCILFGGVIITDSASVNIRLEKNKLHYNTGGGNVAVTVVGEPEADVNHHKRYKIGGDKETANTFVNDENGDGPALVWPYSNTYWETDYLGRKEYLDRLRAEGNYWKQADGSDASFFEVKVGENIQYANEIKLPFKEAPFGNLAVPPTDFAYGKGGTNDSKTGAFIKNSNRVYVEPDDNAMLLFERSFKTNGTSLPLFYEFDIKKINIGSTHETVDLSQPYRIKLLTSTMYKDSSYTTPYIENLQDLKFGNGLGIYWRSFNPVLPMDIVPQSMVSYAGTNEALSEKFPQVWYDFYATNLLYNPADSTSEKHTQLKEVVNTLSFGENRLTKAYLKTNMMDGSTYGPEVRNGTWVGYDEAIDPDRDFFPFLPAFLEGNQVAKDNKQGGVYAIAVGNAENISRLEYGDDERFDINKYWMLPNIGTSWVKVLDCKLFEPTFKTAELIIRPTSGNLTVEVVATTLPGILTHGVAAVDKTAQYKDSTQRTVTQASVFLLDDKAEPDEKAYRYMMDTAKAETATKGRNYAYHFLSLLNKNDGNNVVTTPAEKTVFVPYPADYKAGDPIVMMHFEGYQRMPNDDIENTAVKIIKNEDLLKKEKGFTFTTTGDMGAYILAYGEESSATDPGTKPNPKPNPKPDPKPEEKPAPKPEEKPELKPEEKPAPKPEEKPDLKPEVEKPIDKVVDEVTKNPDIIIRDKETLEEKYPGVNLEDLPVPLYSGQDFVVVQMPNGELAVIGSELVPLAWLPKTDGSIVNEIMLYCFGGAIVLLGIALGVQTRLLRRRKNTN